MGKLDVARRRMRNSRLTGPGLDTAEEVVRLHGAMQAQDYGPAKWSINQRSRGVTGQAIDDAVANGTIVRTHVLRPTWHFVARDDIRWMLALTGPRVNKSIAGRYRKLGLDARTLARCEARIVTELSGGNRLTRSGIADVLQKARIDTTGQRLPHILGHLELVATICSGGLIGKQHSYALLDERVPQGGRFDRDQALVELTRRYLTSHGPATVKDLRWWSNITIADIREALDMLGSEVSRETVGDTTLWSIESEPRRSPNARGVHLLQAYDELIVGYTESRFFGDPSAGRSRAAWQERSIPTGVVLMNGSVMGHWKRTVEPTSVRIDVRTYRRLRSDERRLVTTAANKLGRFLDRKVELEVTRLG